MSGIVCAIRGGPDSQPTIDRAISLAREKKAPVYFLYIVNIDFLSHTSYSRVQTISREMRQMGDFILLAAQTRAEGQGVTAFGEVREGKVSEEIIALCRQIQADYVILGRPQASQDENVFTHEVLNAFGQRIEAETGATVVYAEKESQ